MLKFVVVLYRRPDLSREAFFANLRDEHGPMAERLPGLRRYVQNHVLPDPKRKHPGWDAVIELYWDDWASMEAAWESPEGQAATNHLQTLADLSRSTWSVVEEHVRSPGESDRLFRVERIAARAAEILGGREQAARWLHTPNRTLGGQAPLELLDTDLGCRQVEEALGRIEHGVFS